MTTLTLQEIDGPLPKLDPFSEWLMEYGNILDHALVERLDHEEPVLPRWFALIDAQTEIANGQPSVVHLFDQLRPLSLPTTPRDVINAVWDRLRQDEHDDTTFKSAPFTSFLPVSDHLINGEARGGVQPFVDWVPPAIPGSVPRPLVITAIIDDMVNLAHQHFRSPDGHPRIDFAWVQDIPDDTGTALVPIGREFQRTDIKSFIDAHGDDEERIMRAMDLVDFRATDYNPLAARMNHGTAVASLAAGLDPTTAGDDAFRHRIIAVALPRQVTLDTTGYTLRIPFIWALEYVLQRARDMQDEINRRTRSTNKIPVVINFSYGIAGGPHDGRHEIEVAARRVIDDHQSVGGGGQATLTLPSGNANLGRGHRRGGEGEEHLGLPWRLQPGDQTPSFLEIWFPKETTSVDSLEILAPNGNRLNAGPFDLSIPVRLRIYEIKKLDGTIVGLLAIDQPAGSVKKRLIIILGPTDVPVRPLYRGLPVSEKVVPSGTWRIDVTADQVNSNSRIEAWILRDEAPLGTRVQARQSFFDDAEYQRFTKQGDVRTRDGAGATSLTRRSGTLNGIGTRPDPGNPGSMEPDLDDPLFVAGGHLGKGGFLDRHGDRQEAGYSATAAPGMRQPDAAGESDHSRAIPGKIAAGTRGASLVSLNGTSVAAPQLARLIATYYANDPSLSLSNLRTNVTAALISGPNDAPLDSLRAGKEKWRLPNQDYPLKVVR